VNSLTYCMMDLVICTGQLILSGGWEDEVPYAKVSYRERFPEMST
jgi:hypothetical protein